MTLIEDTRARLGATAQKGGATLAHAHPGRFVLGVGHAFQAAKPGEDACWPPSGPACWSRPASTT
jgi:hypothetical protein